MQVHFGLGALHAEWPQSVLCIGTFDGVHLGHREVIRTAVAQARQRELPCILVTFDRHPAAILAPERKPPSLSTLELNLSIFESLGVSIAVILPFDEALSACSAEDFLNQILVRGLRAGSLVIGHDFAMGHDRVGNPEWLKEHVETVVVPAFEIEGKRVSSSTIRTLVKEGRVAEAAKLLGRAYEVSGVVVKGQQLGRKLGFPTANIGRSYDLVMPSDGVYAGTFMVGGRSYVAAIGIGVRPAVGGTERTVEAYLLDYQGPDLYGQACRLTIQDRLREERNFPSLEALTDQMDKDVQQVRTLAASLKL
jgi:riboflavin kinase/FMN adenylyltransferase